MATANTSIKITQLPNIGNAIAANTVLPVVNLAGTTITQKANVQIIGNLLLAGAGGANFVPAGLANLAYSVVNAAQPNITSVGTLTGLTISNFNNLHIPGGTNGYFLQTDGTGNLSWSAAGGGGGNGIPGGSNSQIQYNLSGSFAGSPNLTWLESNSTLRTSNFYTPGNVTVGSNVSITGKTVSNAVYTDNYFYANGSPFGFNSGNIGFTGDAIYDINGIILENSDLSHGPTAAVIIPSNGNSTVPVQINNTYGNVKIQTGATGAIALSWNFDKTGNLNTPGNLVGPANANFTIFANAGVHDFTFSDDGTFYAPDNVVLGGSSIFIGPGANTLTGLGNAVFIASSNSTQFIQAAINNVSDAGSADWVAYGHRGSDSGGWVDMGFTSSGFGDANYTITGQGDGYVFAQSFYDGQSPGGRGGNLVLATGENGTTNDIVFATGGFAAVNEFARIEDANNTLHFTKDGSSITFFDGSVQTTAFTGDINGSSIANVNSNVSIPTANGNVYVNANASSNQQWIFDTEGNFRIPQGGGIGTAGMGWPGFYSDNGYLSVQGKSANPDYLGQLESEIFLSSADSAGYVNISLYDLPGEQFKSWQFTPAGNLTLPGSGVIGNPANSSLDPLNPNVSTIILTPDSNYYQSLVLDPTSPGHIHLRAPSYSSNIDEPSANIFLGGELSGFEVPYSSSGAPPVRVHSNGNTWTFNTDGNLIVPGNIETINTGFSFSGNISGITTGNPTVVVSLQENVFGGPYTGQVTIYGVAGTTEANGIWYYEAVESNMFQLYNDAERTSPVDGTTWTAYAFGGTAISVGYNNLSITAGNLSLVAANNIWSFNTTGSLDIPAGSHSYGLGRIQSANGYPTLLGYGSEPEHGGPELDWMDGDNPNDMANSSVTRNTLYINDNGLYVGMNENGVGGAQTRSWLFDPEGSLRLSQAQDPDNRWTQKSIKGSVETIQGDPFPRGINTGTFTTVWTASSDIVIGAKMTVRVQNWNGASVEMFDVMIAKQYNNSNVSFSVSNRLKTNNDATDIMVDVDLNGSNQLILLLQPTDYSAAVTYSVTEFNNTFD